MHAAERGRLEQVEPGSTHSFALVKYSRLSVYKIAQAKAQRGEKLGPIDVNRTVHLLRCGYTVLQLTVERGIPSNRIL